MGLGIAVTLGRGAGTRQRNRDPFGDAAGRLRSMILKSLADGFEDVQHPVQLIVGVSGLDSSSAAWTGPARPLAG